MSMKIIEFLLSEICIAQNFKRPHSKYKENVPNLQKKRQKKSETNKSIAF